MPDTRDPLEVLSFELRFLQDGGYGRSPHTPRQPTYIFEDSPTCVNFDDPARPEPCSECLLMSLVPPEKRAEQVPCRHIPLDEHGATLHSLYESARQEEIEEIFGNWLRATIQRLKQERAANAQSRLDPDSNHAELTLGPEPAGGSDFRPLG